MNVLVVGSTGYIGATASEHLTATGHRVIALTRSAVAGPDLRRGDLTDPGSLTAAVTPDIDAVIHIGAPGNAATDLAAVDALAEPLRGTGGVRLPQRGPGCSAAPVPSPSARTPSPSPSTSSLTAPRSSATCCTPPPTASAAQ